MESDADQPNLARYWFEFDAEFLVRRSRLERRGMTGASKRFRPGVGVTGYDEQDCLGLVQAAFDLQPLPPVARSVRDVNVNDLDLSAWYLGDPDRRGVWYPAEA